MMDFFPPSRLGFIGLGNMGRPMAARLVSAGYELQLFDKDASLSEAFVAAHGATGASSIATLARGAKVVITMLPDGKAVREITLGRDGLIENLSPGSVIIDMSSSDPVGTRELGAVLLRNKIALVDAPVSGGVARARDGSLSTMVGGDDAVISRVRPILETMAKHVFLTGPLGTGHAMKALNNLVSAGGLWIATEALLIGERFGLSSERIVDILNASTGRNNSTENKFKQHILSKSFASGFSLGLMAKDLRVAADLATATGQASPLTRLCAELWNEAEGKLGGSQDHTAIIKLLEGGATAGSARQSRGKAERGEKS
ncbi:MAG: NAD(P)-dependent oxidoreductase [Hyphomicrobiales bacterium]|nr:NAD(P)-dependent oxidoreductase [Hyphomicrobiales bacterium]